MKSLPITVALLTATACLAIGLRPAAAQQCTGPFVSCAIEVKAQCSRDPDGNQRMTFTDEHANWMRFEQCVGRIFQAHGQADPFKLASGSPNAGRQGTSGPLTVPYTEMLYPHNYGRD